MMQRQARPSCFQMCLNGFIMGALIGSTFGIILGGFGGWRAGLKGRELLHLAGKSALQSGGTFGFFMSIGTAIRSCS